MRVWFVQCFNRHWPNGQHNARVVATTSTTEPFPFLELRIADDMVTLSKLYTEIGQVLDMLVDASDNFVLLVAVGQHIFHDAESTSSGTCFYRRAGWLFFFVFGGDESLNTAFEVA